ncbi:hypothetical protein ACWGJ2_35255 [Streptomyces sp. NPDC054796]
MTETIPAVGERVLPRPVGELPTPALATAVKNLAGKLVAQFAMEEEAAFAFAQAAVDPAAARKAAEIPERLPVPGGVVLALRTHVWARHVMPDPRNPRIGPSRRHPVSDVVGLSEQNRLRPLPEPRACQDRRPGLVQEIDSQEHLVWAAQQARACVLEKNDWRASIRNQGIMTEVWLAATTFRHGDGTPDVTVPVTAEGSSRLTCAHDILGVRSADVPYTRDTAKLRARLRHLSGLLEQAGEADQVEPDDAEAMRCETLPALLLVGFEPHPSTVTDFDVAVRSLVALRHVDAPKPWGEAAEHEALADAVVNEIARRDLITSVYAEWIAGALTPEQAESHGLPPDTTARAAAVLRLFTERKPEVHQAVRVAITSQSTRKNITTKLLLDLAGSLVMRSVPEEDARRRERTRKYLKTAFSNELAKTWEATFRDAEELSAAALAEVARAEPGPATRELAARSAYPLVVQGQLSGDRGSKNNDQPDRRHPGEVIDRMRATPHGIHQMRQALVDFAAGRRTRMVEEDGQLKQRPDGRFVLAKDAELRRAFPPAGEGPSLVAAPQSPAELLGNALHDLGRSVQGLKDAVKAVESVEAQDGVPAIESLGADRQDCDAWRDVLQDVLEKLPVWKLRSAQRHGTDLHETEAGAGTGADEDEDEDEGEGEDEADVDVDIEETEDEGEEAGDDVDGGDGGGESDGPGPREHGRGA